jgi:lipopolysaccharide biosynthesis regulator YciM
LDNALNWLGKARQLDAGKADVNLERLEAELTIEQMEQAIGQKADELAQDPQNVDLSNALKALREKCAAYRLEQIQALVQRYPNEFSYRYELGQLLFASGETDAAIKELQLAQRSPKVRIDALVLLGEAYQKKGFLDLAIEQLLIVKDEVPGMTDQKKAILYQLGLAYEQQGKMDFAIGEYKLLYGVDIAYRDVADKIDAFYSKQAEVDS